MIFKLYRFERQSRKFLRSQEDISPELFGRLKLFQKEVVREFENAQFGKKGIKSLGNQIKYNSIISTNVFTKVDNQLLVKVTGNRKTFIQDFLKVLRDNDDTCKIYLFVYESHFRKISALVDSTSTKVNDINIDIGLLFSAFDKLQFCHELYILEITGFKNYDFITDYEGFTKIINFSNGN